MSERLWDRADEWVGYAPCAGQPDFILDPTTLGSKRVAAVQKTCLDCPVRPECIELNTAPVIAPFSLKKDGNSNPVTYPSSSVWVAGEWLPDRDTAASRRELEAKKEELVASLPYEYASRPDGVL